MTEHGKADFNLSPSPHEDSSSKDGGTLAPALSPEKDRASPVGAGVGAELSMENLTLDPTCGTGSGLGSGNEGRKRLWKLSSLEVMRAALQSIDIHNWSLFA